MFNVPEFVKVEPKMSVALVPVVNVPPLIRWIPPASEPPKVIVVPSGRVRVPPPVRVPRIDSLTTPFSIAADDTVAVPVSWSCGTLSRVSAPGRDVVASDTVPGPLIDGEPPKPDVPMYSVPLPTPTAPVSISGTPIVADAELDEPL